MSIALFKKALDFVKNPKNRKTVIATGIAIGVASVVAMFTTKRGKAKR